ncbi:MAG: hypothetical protein FWG34_13980 [Oscillospiraceae bacterium]|nr:hypothetical protein [Oscillospiraceae bacterium]
MDNLVQMSTTGRHNMILQSLIGTIYDLILKCSIGAMKLPEQSLANVLKTQKGLEFDLRYLAD